MDEARRFLRYVTPGIVVATEAGLLALVLVPGWVAAEAIGADKDKGLALIAAAFLASGGLGYLISVIHHTAHWSPILNWSRLPTVARYGAVDHSRLIADLISEARLTVSQGGNQVVVFSRAAAWHVTTALWRSREHRNLIKASTPNLNTLTDLMHSAGTSAWGALVATVFAVVLGATAGEQRPMLWQWGLALAMGLSMIALHWRNYRRLGRGLQAYIYQILTEEIAREARCGRPAVPVSLAIDPSV